MDKPTQEQLQLQPQPLAPASQPLLQPTLTPPPAPLLQPNQPPPPSPLTPANQTLPNQQAQQQQTQQAQISHILFELTPSDVRDEIEEKTHRTYQLVKQITSGKPAKDCLELYNKFASQPLSDSQASPTPSAGQPPTLTNIEDITMGLLVAILVESDGSHTRHYRDVVAFSKDGLALFSTYLNMIIIERLQKLREHSIRNIIWLTNQMIKANITSAENISFSLMRQLAGGDLSPKNLLLIECVLELLIDNRNWLISSTTFMVPTTIYTFMRLIADHFGQAQNPLRQKEVDFVIGLVRDQFAHCLLIGRDFLRLLNNITKIPEFEKLSHDIFNNPKSIHPTFHSPLQLLTTRTPRRLIQSRLTFDMERKISFLATQVKFGNQKRYQDSFHKQYLSTPESLSLRNDLIRYICSLIHPSNEVLCSDIIPRWAIIGWLLATCTTNISATNSKIALFYDWLVYDPKVDNIMNIEPAILLMFHSLRSHPNVTAGLLDFLCRLPSIFLPKLGDHLKMGIKKSLQQILEKRVIQTLAPLFDNPKHDPLLKALIKETFPDFCSQIQSSQVDNGISNQQANSPSIQVNHPVATNMTPANPKKEPDLVTIDHDNGKSNHAVEASIPALDTINCDRLQSNQETNHISFCRSGDNIAVQNEDKLECNATPSSSVHDEPKTINSWNATEPSNLSNSQKAPNRDNKNKKCPTNNSNTNNDSVKRPNKRSLNQLDEISDIGNTINTNSSNDDTPDHMVEPSSSLKVIYPFMVVPDLDLKEVMNSFDNQVRGILEDLSLERCNDTRCNLMDKLISIVFENNELSTNPTLLRELGHCLAHLLASDFYTKIFPSSSSQDITSLEESISSPLFVLFRNAFSTSNSASVSRPMSLLVHVSKFFDATGFLVLYFLRVYAIMHGSIVSSGYIEFCNSARRKLNKSLYDDLYMAQSYDSVMFCFMLPSIFGEVASCGSFMVTGNIDLIRLVVSSVDPINLQELICLCLTGTAKVINKEDVLPLIESSLCWESWEQYCVWKLICAQSVPIENYISILPRLDTKANSEAMSCILLNLQRVSEPTTSMLQIIIDCECKTNDPFISSILRYWSMKTDVKELANIITSLVDSRPLSPPAKRKGQAKAATKSTNITLSPRSEKILYHLESIRQRAPKNKLLAQPEIIEMISQLETVCNESQKKIFADLFLNRPKPTKKKRFDKEMTT